MSAEIGQYKAEVVAGTGLRPMPGSPCVRRIVGLRCLRGSPSHRCICERLASSRVWDHAVLWRAGNNVLLTLEPYANDIEGLLYKVVDLNEELEEIGVAAGVHLGRGRWNTGTELVVLTRAAA